MVLAGIIDHSTPGNLDQSLKDGPIRLILIPLLGILISNITGLFGPFHPGHPVYWLGTLYFIALSAFIWQGNRYMLLKQREHFDWFNHPVRKVAVLLFANVFYTAPVTAGMLWGWYTFSGLGYIDNTTIKIVTLINVICVVFITHIYETVYLIQQRENDLLRFERLERARVTAELEALKNQLDPHFMFNSLNTLTYLIDHHTNKAISFCQNLSDVYRYILTQKSTSFVFLRDELEFIRSYFDLLRLRFDESIQIRIEDLALQKFDYILPPISLQLLLENAVKHNEFSKEHPLVVFFELRGDELYVCNERRPRQDQSPSTGIGLNNLSERFELLTGKRIQIKEEDRQFVVVVPLLTV